MPSSPDCRAEPVERKRRLRREILAARAAMDPAARVAAGAALTRRALALPELRAAERVAGWVAVGSEPPTAELLAALRERGATVLLPVLRPDRDLDWAVDDGRLTPGPHGLLEPTGPRLGPAAVGTAAVILVPALAVARDGVRLGRGGGSYDRALARTEAWSVALVYDDELRDRLPAQPHDRPVAATLTPAVTHRSSR